VIVVGLVFYALLGLASDALVRAWERKALAYRKAIGS
jgi:sulfonate transport system permease protein